jgi:hypothetical protein
MPAPASGANAIATAIASARAGVQYLFMSPPRLSCPNIVNSKANECQYTSNDCCIASYRNKTKMLLLESAS